MNRSRFVSSAALLLSAGAATIAKTNVVYGGDDVDIGLKLKKGPCSISLGDDAGIDGGGEATPGGTAQQLAKASEARQTDGSKVDDSAGSANVQVGGFVASQRAQQA